MTDISFCRKYEGNWKCFIHCRDYFVSTKALHRFQQKLSLMMVLLYTKLSTSFDGVCSYCVLCSLAKVTSVQLTGSGTNFNIVFLILTTTETMPCIFKQFTKGNTFKRFIYSVFVIKRNIREYGMKNKYRLKSI